VGNLQNCGESHKGTTDAEENKFVLNFSCGLYLGQRTRYRCF